MSDTLPLWPIAPNWADPITEQIEFRTAIMSGALGHEQRQAMRFRPRRSIEATFAPFESERAFVMLALQRKGAEQWRVPLWFDSTRLTAAAGIGATSLYFNTVGREYRSGDFAYLVGPDAFSGERVEVLDVLPDRITLVDGTTRAWGAGTQIHPCRRAWIDAGELGNVTSRAAQFSARFDIDTDSDYDFSADDAPQYQGHPLLVHRPNWAESVTYSFEQRFAEFDPGVGPRSRFNIADRAFAVNRYSLLLHGQAEISAFRSLAYRLRGSQRAVWVPSHGLDTTVAAPAAMGDSTLDVARIGFELMGGITPDIAHVLIGNDEAVHLVDLGSAPASGQERLQLEGSLGRDVAVGERISLLSLARLEQDVVKINHITDGVATANVSWKSFTEGRDGTAAGVLATPVGVMNDTPCGVAVCPTIQTGSWPLVAQVNVPNPLPAYSLDEYRLNIDLQFLVCHPTGGLLRVILYMGAAGPTVSCQVLQVTDESEVAVSFTCLTDSIGNPCGSLAYGAPTTYDYTFPIIVDGLELSGRFYYTGSQIGIEISDPNGTGITPATDLAVPFDNSVNIWGTPYQDPAVTAAGFLRVLLTGITTELTTSLANNHDFNAVITHGGVVSGGKIQRLSARHNTYEPARVLRFYAVFGARRTYELTKRITETQLYSLTSSGNPGPWP